MATNWQTPKDFFDGLDKIVGGFAVDAAGDSRNHLCRNYYGPGSLLGEDALAIPHWLSPAFCNPPYGRGIQRWLKKFHEQAEMGCHIIALLPARTETRWWYEGVVNHSDIIFLVGRLPFVDPERTKQSQPDHGSALCYFGPDHRYREVNWCDWRREIIGYDPNDPDSYLLPVSGLAIDREDGPAQIE